jgi:arsenate reductase
MLWADWMLLTSGRWDSASLLVNRAVYGLANELGVVMFENLGAYIEQRLGEYDSISEDRKKELERVSEYVRNRLGQGKKARLTFICTHNSRRSHLSQIWAKIAAEYYGLKGVETYSGGTEGTAFNPRAVEALRRCGLLIVARNPESTNPVYQVQSSVSQPVQECFSKVYDAPPNPVTEYCAVMTCTQADEACPVVTGCELRVPIRYEDPKVADDTPEESARYDERSRQICREMFYMMSMVQR